ncbi:uncharacterized protein LOC135477235 [Liolophura sinensis]|uniref:uncharacterized protein LOC135477235 n=1 Tax=Liolophura sinensis TaxID=3198878 RepID=UPI003158DF47
MADNTTAGNMVFEDSQIRSGNPATHSGATISCGDDGMKVAPVKAMGLEQEVNAALHQKPPTSSCLRTQPENNCPPLQNQEVLHLKPTKDLSTLSSEPLCIDQLGPGDIERSRPKLQDKQELWNMTNTTKPDFMSQSPVVCHNGDFFSKNSSPKEKTPNNFSSIFDGIF